MSVMGNMKLQFIRHADKGIYYYTTYDNHQITAVDMNKEKLDGSDIVRYPLVCGEQIFRQN